MSSRTGSSGRFERAIERFDQANAEDPRHEVVDGREEPRELVYARRMSDRLRQFQPDASEPLRLAVRSQHIARWTIPRSDFPAGRQGYKQWRTRLMSVHAELAGRLMLEVGYDEDTVRRVQQLLRKQGLKRDPDVQTLEDVVCLVFLEHYFDAFAAEHEDEKLIDILRKTWAKMSDRGHAAALTLDLSDRAKGLVGRALDGA